MPSELARYPKRLVTYVISPFEASILGFFRQGRFSSYDLVKVFRDNSFYWSGSPGAVYSAVRRLETAGLVYARSSTKAKLYGVTDAGEEALLEFCRSPVPSQQIIVDPIALRVKLRGSVYLEPKERQTFYGKQLDQLEGAIHFIKSKQIGLEKDSMSYRLADLAIEQLALERCFLERLMTDIKTRAITCSTKKSSGR